MQIKKIAIAVSSAALMFAVAVPAMANGGWGHSNDTTNVAIVSNSSTAVADTGFNTQKGGNNDMKTGNAKANSKAVVVANTQVGCGCDKKGDTKNIAVVRNESLAGASTGYNDQKGAKKGGNGPQSYGGGHHNNGGNNGGTNNMTTGNANSNSSAWTVVNTQVSGL